MDAFSQSSSLWNKVYQTGSRDRSSSRFYLRFQKAQPEIEENSVFYQTNPIGLIDRIRSPSAFVELAAHCLPAISNSVFVDHETDVRVPLESRRVGSHGRAPTDSDSVIVRRVLSSFKYAKSCLPASSPIGFRAQPLDELGERVVVGAKDAKTLGIGESAFEIVRF